jgi:dTDP-4-dehydrorhamnose 3,5-epimerase
MIFHASEIDGVFVVEPEPIHDERGFFARVWSSDEFEARGLAANLVQLSISFNRSKHTLRGMHWQDEPHGEAKLVRCVRGSIYDVVADLRPESASFGQWRAFRLTDANRRALYVPPLVAHGFQTLADETEIAYAMSANHEPAAARGFRWDDPGFAIDWPDAPARIMSERDRTWPDLSIFAPQS